MLSRWEVHNSWQAKFLNLASTLFNRKVYFRQQPKSQDCCICGGIEGFHLLCVVEMSAVRTRFLFCSYICYCNGKKMSRNWAYPGNANHTLPQSVLTMMGY